MFALAPDADRWCVNRSIRSWAALGMSSTSERRTARTAAATGTQAPPARTQLAIRWLGNFYPFPEYIQRLCHVGTPLRARTGTAQQYLAVLHHDEKIT